MSDHDFSSIRTQLQYHEKELIELKSTVRNIDNEVTLLKVEIAKLSEIIKSIREDIKESNRRSMWKASLLSSIIVASASIVVDIILGLVP